MLCMLLTDSRDEFAASARPFGPAAGRPGVAAGGQVIAQGTPEQVAQEPGSHTGRFLAEILGADDGHGA